MVQYRPVCGADEEEVLVLTASVCIQDADCQPEKVRDRAGKSDRAREPRQRAVLA